MPKTVMIEAKFRRLMLVVPESVRQSILSDREIEIVKYVERKGPKVTTRDAADAFYCSTSSMSVQMSKLIDKGYLYRVKMADPTGGKMYAYSVRAEIWSSHFDE